MNDNTFIGLFTSPLAIFADVNPQVVLLNLVRLRELGVEYCPLLRKSEDLALCHWASERRVLEDQCHRCSCICLFMSMCEAASGLMFLVMERQSGNQ